MNERTIMTQKVLYLDIDGPLVPGFSFFRPGRGLLRYSTDNVEFLMNMCEELGVKIVISSSKRINKQKLFKELESNGFDLSVLHDDWCIDLPIDNRSARIRDHLARNDIDAYASLDDESLDDDIINVQVNFFDGVLMEHVACMYIVFGSRVPYDLLLDNANHLADEHILKDRVCSRIRYIDAFITKHDIKIPE